MTAVQLAFKAFDCHELLCHAVAREAGLYRQNHLSVTLMDSTFIPEEALPNDTFTVACGAVLAGFVQRGGDHRVVFVACDRPMFWLYARPGVASLADLEGGRVATFPDEAPPAGFLRRLLAEAAVSPVLLPCRDDVARLGLLRSGSADAALLSSRYLPHQLEADGLKRLAFVGESIRLPSTGLAVSTQCLKTAPERVAVMVAVFRQAMELIFGDDELTCRVLAATFDLPQAGLHDALGTVRECFNRSGHTEMSVLQAAVDRVAKGMGRDSRRAAGLYDFSFLRGGPGASGRSAI